MVTYTHAYSTIEHNRLQSDGRYNYLYDAEGNLATRHSLADDSYRVFEWDHRNRLTAVLDYDAEDTLLQRVEYTYDAFNRRIAKHLDTDLSGLIDFSEFYIYDGTDIVLDFVDVDGVEWVGTEDEDLPAAVAKRYLWGPAVDQLLAQELYDAGLDETVQVLWAAADHQGTVRDYLQFFDGEGTELYTHFALDSFGNILDGDTSQVRYIYTGQEFDVETGMYYYDARYVIADIGRFISEDPIGFHGDPSNVFRYVVNAPTIFVDPTGHNRWVYFAYGHSFIVVEVWDATGTVVVGYAQLHFNVLGHEVINGLPPFGDCDASWSSTCAQDRALLNRWRQFEWDDDNMGVGWVITSYFCYGACIGETAIEIGHGGAKPGENAWGIGTKPIPSPVRPGLPRPPK